jgi:hypothetical protein
MSWLTLHRAFPGTLLRFFDRVSYTHRSAFPMKKLHTSVNGLVGQERRHVGQDENPIKSGSH